MVFEMGSAVDTVNAEHHLKVKDALRDLGPPWEAIDGFQKSATMSYEYARRSRISPFDSRRYSFEDASMIASDLVLGYGKWQNSDCVQMKNDLISLDHKGNGRVTLAAFYSRPDSDSFAYSESVSYLRQIGALDETIPSAPSVILVNYVLGPTNCIATSEYYSVCCLNGCEALMNEIETEIRAPSATSEVLIGVVGNLSLSPKLKGRRGEVLAAKLRFIAERNDGVIPLHGRLFGQWLHHAFPHECPYPHIADDVNALMPNHWQEKATLMEDEDKAAVARKLLKSAGEEHIETDFIQWSDAEVLLVYSADDQATGRLRQMAGILMKVVIFCVAIPIVFTAWTRHAFTQTIGRDAKKGTKPAYKLPF
jgi:hypothetical protein